MWTHGHFYWNELMTRDAEKAKAFYGGALDWSFEGMQMDGPTYWVCKVGDQPVGGIFTMEGADFDGIPEHWFTYLAVDDVDARVEKAVAAGAKLMRPAFDVPNIGRIAILQTPGGAMMGWMTPAQQG
ncbi:MAG: VOC family protein [Hyphomicrobiales bacterium]|nr:VOC family protein [Hyphomicrobiales bacterium]